MKKFICMILCVLTVVLTACSGEPAVTDTVSVTERQTEAVTEPVPGTVYVFDDGIKEDDGQIGTDQPEPQSYSYSQDFEKKIGSSDKDWYINNEGTLKDGVFSSKTNHAYFANKHKIKADVFVAEWDVNSNRGGNIDNVSEYIGLRLPEYGNQFAAVGTNGIWLAFHAD